MKTVTALFFLSMYTLVAVLTAIAIASEVYELFIFALAIFAVAVNETNYHLKHGE